MWKFFFWSSTDKLMSGFISWGWGEFPGAYEVCVCSIDGFRSLVVGLKAPSTFCCLNLCLTWLSWSDLTSIFQVGLVCWKQGFHFLWKLFTWSSADKLVSRLVGWRWGEFPGSYEVSIRSIDGFGSLVIGLEAPCTFCCLNFRFAWLRWSRLTTIFQVCLVCWKQVFHFLWKLFTWGSTDKLVSCLVGWSWGEFPCSYEVCVCSIDGFRRLVVGLEAPSAFCRLHFRFTWLSWSDLTSIFQVCLSYWKQIFYFLWKLFAWSSTDKLVCRLVGWRWGEFPCSYKVCVCSIDGFGSLIV